MATKVLKPKPKEKTTGSIVLPQSPFFKPDKTSDIVFIVEGQKIHFTKAFLIAVSPVFECMFEKDFAEKRAKEIPLPGKKYEEMVEFFKHIHPAFATNSVVTDANLLALLNLSREYQMDAVRERCQHYICKEADIRSQISSTYFGGPTFTKLVGKQDLDARRVILFIYGCEQHGFQEYVDALKDIASTKRTTEIEGSDYFSLLQDKTLLDIYKARCKSNHL